MEDPGPMTLASDSVTRKRTPCPQLILDHLDAEVCSRRLGRVDSGRGKRSVQIARSLTRAAGIHESRKTRSVSGAEASGWCRAHDHRTAARGLDSHQEWCASAGPQIRSSAAGEDPHRL